MLLYGVRLVINFFDLCVYRRYLDNFVGKCRTSVELSILLLVVCEVAGSIVNQMDINWLNLVTTLAIFSIYICQYEAKLSSRIIAVLLYMGIMVITEPVGYLFNKAFLEKLFGNEMVSYYFTVFIMTLLRAFIVEIFSRMRSERHIHLSMLPKETQYMLALIPLCSVISCFVLIEVSTEWISGQLIIFCMCIIFTIIIINYAVFLMIENYTIIAARQHEEELVQREIAYKNEYYQDMERYQEQIQDIRHDMKNRLIGLLAAAEQGKKDLIMDRLQEIMGDISQTEDIMYSVNPVVNAILKVKSTRAKEQKVVMKIDTLLPRRVSVDIGDMGIMFGNLLDNAIEAAMSVEAERRFVQVKARYREGRLLLQIQNSKNLVANPKFHTTKKDRIRHGRGIRLVRKVAEKYGGELLLEDHGDNFEATLLLNGVEQLE